MQNFSRVIIDFEVQNWIEVAPPAQEILRLLGGFSKQSQPSTHLQDAAYYHTNARYRSWDKVQTRTRLDASNASQKMMVKQWPLSYLLAIGNLLSWVKWANESCRVENQNSNLFRLIRTLNGFAVLELISSATSLGLSAQNFLYPWSTLFKISLKALNGLLLRWAKWQRLNAARCQSDQYHTSPIPLPLPPYCCNPLLSPVFLPHRSSNAPNPRKQRFGPTDPE